MNRKSATVIIFLAFLLSANCAFCGANGSEVGGGSDEVIVMKKDAPAAVTSAAAVTFTAVPAVVSATAAPSVTVTAKPAKSPKPSATPKKKSTPAAEQAKTPAVEVSPEQKEINELVAKVKEKQAGRKAMICDISIKTSALGAASSAQEVLGTVSMKKKDKFKVHYTRPTEQFLISNAKWMWVYTPGMKQVIKQAAKDAALDTNFYIEIENSIEYFVNNSRTRKEESDSAYTLIMVPRDKKNLNFDEITVRIEKSGLVPEYMSMKYEGAMTEVAFSNVKNYTAAEAAEVPELSDANFEFKAPEGVDEIEASALMDAATQ
jgi:chaperone LolA